MNNLSRAGAILALATGLFCAALPAAESTTAKKGKEDAGEYSVRLLAGGEMPERLIIPGPKPEKKGTPPADIELGLSEDAVSPAQVLPKSVIAGGTLTFECELARVQNGKALIDRRPFSKITLPEPKPYLVSFYKPYAKGRASTLKSIVTDISEKNFPSGKILVQNLSDDPVSFALGTQGGHIDLAPGAEQLLPLPAAGGDGRILTRIVMRHEGAQAILAKAPEDFPGSRPVLVITSADPATNAGSPGAFRIHKLD